MPPATFFYEANEAVETLGAGSDAPFESRTRFLVFAASVGCAKDAWIDDHDENGEMRWSYIADSQRLAVIAGALAYAHTGDPEAIMDAETQIEVLTSYGAGGARILQDEVVEASGDNLDNLVQFIKDHQRIDDPPRIGILEQIEKEVSSLRPSESD